ASWSKTIRTARWRTSGEYRFDLLMAPSSQGLEPPGIPVRFIGRFNERIRDDFNNVSFDIDLRNFWQPVEVLKIVSTLETVYVAQFFLVHPGP
ncbi:hypothetical protein, partial [Vreelandella indica]|uniref:hypothetical protein n=1 Tax=Vreelandella indica TaxID=3126500 RepID=UPI00300E2BB7